MTYNTKIWKENEDKYQEHWEDKGIGGVFNDIDTNAFSGLEKYINEEGFLKDFEKCLHALSGLGKKIHGKGADLACGSMWLTSYVVNKFEKVLDTVYSVDFSRKNIFNLGQKLLTHYKVNPEKLFLCLGSFYDIKLPSESLDFVVMSQAFHHADDPDKFLQEASRVLKKEGFLIMIGELYIKKRLYLKCYLNYLMACVVSSKYFPSFLVQSIEKLKKMKERDLRGSFQALYFPPDPQMGDHYHLKSQYEGFFSRNKFNFVHIKSTQSNHLAYVLYKS